MGRDTELVIFSRSVNIREDDVRAVCRDLGKCTDKLIKKLIGTRKCVWLIHHNYTVVTTLKCTRKSCLYLSGMVRVIVVKRNLCGDFCDVSAKLHTAFCAAITLKPCRNCLGRYAADIRRRFGPRWDTPLGRFVRRFYMFLIFIPAALLFRAESLGQIGVMFTRLFTQVGFSDAYVQQSFDSLGMNGLTMAQVILSIICMAKIYRLTEYDLVASPEGTRQGQRTAGYAMLILVIALGWIALLATNAAAGFAYFQF